MPRSEDIIAAEKQVKEKAVDIIVEREKCSKSFAKSYVDKLSKDELAKLTGIKRGGAYCNW